MPFTYITGSGTQQNPYVISSLEAWNEFVTHTRTNAMTDQYVELGADIEFNDVEDFYEWSHDNPPANSTAPMYEYYYNEIDLDCKFAGHLDGKGYKFIGMYFDKVYEYNHYMHVLYSEGTIKNIWFEQCFMRFGISDSASDGDYDNGGQLIYVGGSATPDDPVQVSNIIISDCAFYFEGKSMYATLVDSATADGIHVLNSYFCINTSLYATYSGFFGRDITVTNFTIFNLVGFKTDYISLYPLACCTRDGTVPNGYSTYIKNSFDGSYVDITTEVQVDADTTYSNNVISGLTLASVGAYSTVEVCGNSSMITAFTEDDEAPEVLANNASFTFGGVAFSRGMDTTVSDCYFAGSVQLDAGSSNINVKFASIVYKGSGSNTVTVSNCWAMPHYHPHSDDNEGSVTSEAYNISNATISNCYAVCVTPSDELLESASDFSSISVVDNASIGSVESYPTLDFDNTWLLRDDGMTPPEFKNSNNGRFKPVANPFTYITGTGTEQDPYIISSVDGWYEFIDYAQYEGNVTLDDYYQLGADIIFNDITNFDNWDITPPANPTEPMDIWEFANETAPGPGVPPESPLREFTSVPECNFDGNGYKFVGAYINEVVAQNHSIGLSFINFYGGHVRNLIFDHCYIKFGTVTDYSYYDDYYGPSGDPQDLLLYCTNEQGYPAENIEVRHCTFRILGIEADLIGGYVDGVSVDDETKIYVDTPYFGIVGFSPWANLAVHAKGIKVEANMIVDQQEVLDPGDVHIIAVAAGSNSSLLDSFPASVVNCEDHSIISVANLAAGNNVSVCSLYQCGLVTNCCSESEITVESRAINDAAAVSYSFISAPERGDRDNVVSDCYNLTSINIQEQTSPITNLSIHGIYSNPYTVSGQDNSITDTYSKLSLTIDPGTTVSAFNCYNISDLPSTTSYYKAGQLPNALDGTALGNDADFANSENFQGFDFENTWTLEDSDHPLLQSHMEEEPEPEPEPEETYELILRQNYDNYGTVTGAGNYAEGESVVITATPSSGYAFVRWNDRVTENPRTIIMPASSITYTAGFGFTLNAVSADATMGSVTGSGNYCPGEQATITAVPNAGYRFSQWNDDNTDNPRDVWADNITFTATFVQIVTHTVTLTSNDANLGSVAGSGTYEHGTQVTLVATPASESIRFNGWSDGETNPTRTVVLTDDLTLTATFEQLYSLTLSSSSGSQCASFVGAGLHSVGEEVSVVAVPASGYRFTSWSDLNTSASRTVVMPASDLALTAAFQSLVEISVSDDTDSITYTSADGDLTRTGNTYSGWFNTSGSINVTLVPGEDRALSAWSDGETALSRVISTADPVSIAANTFRDVAVYTLTVGTNDSNLGTATGGGDYDAGTVVEIQAIAAQGISFVGWSDGPVINPRGVTVNSDMTINAIFGYMLQVFQSEYGTVSGEGAYAAGSTAVLTATPVENFYFAEWSDHNTDNPRTVTVDADASYEPVFRMKKTLTVQSNNGANGGVSFSEEGPFENSITTMVVPGTEVTVYTSPAQQYQLSSWSDGGSGTTRTITVNDDLAVTAVFSKILRTFYINVETNDSELGNVTGEGYAQEDSYITITAVPRAGARFIGWNDGNMQTTRSILVTGDATYTATFEEIIYFTVEATSNDPVFGHVDGAGIFEEGSQITLTAVPEEGYAFSAWSDGVLSPSRVITLDENKSFHAIFMKLYHRMVNTYRYDGKVGRMKANGKIYSSITLYRSLDLAENACVELGQFDTNTGKHFIFVSVKDATRYILKQYSLSLNHNHTSGEWFRADPLDSSDLASNEFQLEVKSDGVSAALRLKRLTGGDELDFQVVIQNLGIEDESWFEGQEAYIDTTEVPSYIESMPAGLNRCDHMHLANRGDHTHAEIDAHLDAENPHPGHEVISDKNVPNGYAGLDDAANVPLEHLPIGGDDDQLVLGSDPRLSDDRYPTAHAHSHTVDGDDTIFLSSLAGNLVQNRTHDSADTDNSNMSIHHTIGTGATQAAAGNHLHDERYAPIAQGVLGGNEHSHDGEDTAKVDHVNLLNKGVYTHEQIDAHLEATTPHSGHEDKANKDIPNGYAGLNALGKIKSEEISFGSGAGSVCEGNDPRLTNARPPSVHAQYHAAESSDPITISTLAGNLTQARSHDSADTDSTVASIHHTIGTGATQAAAGNHNHDSAYAPVSMLLADDSDIGPNLRVSNTADTYVLGTVAVTTEVETGETDPVSGDPVTETVTELKTRFHKLSHNDLSDKGTYDHTDIDQFINDATQYEVTARRGQADGYASLDANGRIPLSQMPLSTASAVPNVADIAARDAMTNVADGAQVRVLDASADASVDSGWALYTYYADQDVWVKLAEQESLDMVTDWSNLQNKPASTVSAIDTAVGQAHGQNTDQALDYGGNNEVTAAAIKAHLESFTAHAGNEVLSNKGQPDGYAELDSTGRLPTAQLPLNIAAATADSATTAVSATTAGHATTADSATTADTATSAGSAAEADALSEAFAIVLSGDATGSVSIDGSADVTLNVTIPALSANQFSLMSAEEVEAIIV